MSDIAERTEGGYRKGDEPPLGVAAEPAASQVAHGAVGAARRHRRSPFAPIRFVIRRLLWLVISLVRALWRYPIVALALVLALYLGYRGYQDYLAPQPPPSTTPQYDIAPAIPPADAVVHYLQAQRDFNAEEMWQSLSGKAQAANIEQGNSLGTLRERTESLRSSGVRYGKSAYIGGYRLPQGLASYFYVTEVSNGDGAAEIYQVFLVDTDGKILNIEASALQ
ncbi:MAG: hypothetical protein IRY97_11760 [Thermomicrobiaceae bacterium]|nr:hypothetical protein [Thermomicrobiaceae bacterium]